MKKKQFSIVNKFLKKMLILVFFLLGFWSFIWIHNEFSYFKSESESLRSHHIQMQKMAIKKEVEQAVHYITEIKNQSEERLNQLLKKRVYEAHSIATHIYQKNIGIKSISEIQEMIKEALRPISFFDGRGYFFAVSLDGIEQLYPVKPEFEGKNVLNLQDARGNFVIQNEIDLIKESNEGFVKHFWVKPKGNSSQAHLKISFVKFFKPLNWYIGTGEYLDEAQKAIQSQALEHLVTFRFGEEGYLFGSTFEGDSLFSNGKITIGSDNIWGLTDPGGVKIIQKQFKVARKSGGGFVEYTWHKLKHEAPSPKISFVKGIPGWKWTIGAGVYLDTIEAEISERKDTLVKKLKEDVFRSIMVSTILLCLILLWYWRASNQIKQSMDSFISFLEKARTKSVTIDPDTLQFKEFKMIAVSTNQMLKNRIKAEKFLLQSEQRFKLAMEATQDGLWDWIIQTDDVYYSPGYAAILGYDSTQIPSGINTWKDLLHPEDKEIVLKANMDCIENRCSHINVKFRMKARNGEWRWVLGQGKAVERDINGQAIRMIGTHTDITEKKSTEQDLIRNAKDLRETQKIAHLGSWRLDLETNEVYWTKELYKMFGFDPALPPPPYAEYMKLFTPDSWELLSASLAKTTGGMPYELELETVKKDGNSGWIWVRGNAIKNLEGKIIGHSGAAQDISDRKRTELALKESEERFRALHNASFGGIAIHDKGIVLECNEGLSNITGYDYKELIGMNGLSLISEHTREKVIQNIKKGYEKPYEAMGRRKDGTIYPLRLEARNIPYKGRMVRTVEFRDITDKKNAEKERDLLESQLQQSQKMESIGNLAGGIAHDFNNLLYPIIGFAEMLKEDLSPNSPEHESAQEIFNAGKRGGELVKQILAFSRQSDHKLQPVRIQKILNEVLKLTRSSIPSDIEIHQDIQQDCGSVMAEATQLHQIAMNLITNAYHAVENESGMIWVQLKEIRMDAGELKDSPLKPGQYARISFSDNGVGIPQNLIDKIFEPYFTTKEKGKGTGLGLAVVYGIVKAHKGDINVSSQEGKGTAFKVYLPLMKKPRQVVSTGPVSVLPTGRERLLLVDDEKSVIRLEKQMLERLGYTVVAKSSSIEALENFKVNPDEYDLVVTDMTMPNMTGDKLAKEILSIRSDMPIIICTGFSERINKEQAKAIGVNGFLMKPVVKSEMAQMVRKALDENKISNT